MKTGGSIGGLWDVRPPMGSSGDTLRADIGATDACMAVCFSWFYHLSSSFAPLFEDMYSRKCKWHSAPGFESRSVRARDKMAMRAVPRNSYTAVKWRCEHVMELASKGDLVDFLSARQYLSDGEALYHLSYCPWSMGGRTSPFHAMHLGGAMGSMGSTRPSTAQKWFKVGL